MDDMAAESSPSSKRLVFSTHSVSNVVIIKQVDFVCDFCNKWNRIYIPFNKTLACWTKKAIDQEFTILQRINNDVPWYFKTYTTRSSYNTTLLANLSTSTLNKQVTLINFPEYLQTNLSIELLLFTLAVPNATFADTETWFKKGNTSSKTKFDLNRFSDRSHVKFFPSVRFIEVSPYFFPDKDQFYSFITCSGTLKNLIDFSGFISAFDLISWLLLIICFLAIGMFNTFATKNNAYDTIRLFIGFKILLEQSDAVIKDSKQERHIYWLFGTTILMAVVLSNAYRGSNITSLTAPLKPVLLTNFSQLVDLNFTIYTKIFDYYDDEIRIGDKCTEMKSLDLFEGATYGRTEYHKIFDVGERIESVLKPFTPKEREFYMKSLFYKIKAYENCDELIVKNKTFLDLIKDCNQTAYTGWSNEIDSMEQNMRLLGFDMKHVSKGKEVSLSKRMKWDIRFWGNDQIIQRLAGLIESGIANKWRLAYSLIGSNQVNKDKMKHRDKAVAVNLSTNILTLFMLLVTLLAVAICLFLSEIRRYLIPLIFKFLQTCIQFAFSIAIKCGEVRFCCKNKQTIIHRSRRTSIWYKHVLNFCTVCLK